jgi:hypothetical protein
VCPASRQLQLRGSISSARRPRPIDCALLLVPAYLAWRGRRSVCGWLPTMLLLPLFLAIIIGLASAGRPDVAAVFVSAALGDDRNDGLGRLTPVRSLSHAVSLARHRSRRIFLDADQAGTPSVHNCHNSIICTGPLYMCFLAEKRIQFVSRAGRMNTILARGPADADAATAAARSARGCSSTG